MTETAHAQPMTVLVIDDEPNNRFIVIEMLEGHYRVLTAADGEEGLRLAGQARPDLILLDLRMPGLDGYEVCRRLKREPATAAIPVVVVSALGQTDDKLLAFEAGCDDYVTKPFSIQVLRAKLGSLLQTRALEALRTQQLVDLMPHGVSIRDESGTLLLANQYLADFLGLEKTGMTGQPLLQLLDSDRAARWLQQDQRVLRRETDLLVIEEQFADARGEPRWLHITKSRYESGCGPAVLSVSTDITAMKETEQALEEREEQLAEAERLAGFGSFVIDLVSGRVRWSKNLYRLLGLTRDALPEPNLETLLGLIPSSQAERVRTAFRQGVDQERCFELEHAVVTASGAEMQVHARAEVERNAEGVAVQVRGTVQDITERRAQEAWRQVTTLMFEQMAEAVIVTDADRRILHVNQAFTQITGYSPEEALGKTPALLKSEHHGAAFYQQLWKQLAGQGHWQGEVWNRRKDGNLYPSWLSISAISDREGGVTHYIGLSRDLSEDKRLRERLHYLTNYDIQTGLPNRNLLLADLASALAVAEQEQQSLALVCIQVNDFELVNESLGYLKGDAYIAELASALTDAAPEQGRLGRVDTATLAMLLPRLDSAGNLLPVLQQLLALNQTVVALQEQEVPVSLNIGVAAYPADASESGALLDCALSAVTQSVARGRGSLAYYAPGINNLVQSRLLLQAELYKALETNAFYLHYQPKLDLRTGQIQGAEALIRWRHPQKGVVPPGDFIPVAETCGLIQKLGFWVLEEACRQAKAWQEAGLLRGPLAVNLSPEQLKEPGLTEQIQQVLQRHRLEPRWLELEITESALMSEPELAVETLQGLRALGVGISLDDFGTGHSSLHYLSRLPVDKLKIDRSFVHRCLHQPEDALIIRTLISLAQGLKLKIVAEGVETTEQFAYLSKLQCDELQGYYFSKPVEAAEFEAFTRNYTGLDQGLLSDHGDRTLLLIDDEPHVISALRRLLRREGYRILTANSGQEARQLLATESVEVVVCDQRMPDISGSAFFREIKQTHPRAVRVILSGYTDVDAITQAINEGEVYKFLTKPWEEEELLETLQSAFDKYDLEN